MPHTPPTDSTRSILENVNAPELPSLPADLGKALSEACRLFHVVSCIHRTVSDLALLNTLSSGEIYAQGVNLLPELIKDTEAAVGPVLEEIRDATEKTVRFGTFSGLSVYEVVLKIAHNTVRLAKHAETSKFPFSEMIKKPPEREEWDAFMVELGKEARDAGRARPRRSERKKSTNSGESQTPEQKTAMLASALLKHHGLDEDAAEFNLVAATQEELKKTLEWSNESQVNRHMGKIFGKNPMTGYKRMLSNKDYDGVKKLLKKLLQEHAESLLHPNS